MLLRPRPPVLHRVLHDGAPTLPQDPKILLQRVRERIKVKIAAKEENPF